MIETQQERSETGTARQTQWAIIGLVVIAMDLLGLYAYLGKRIYLLNPVWIYLSVYVLLFLGYVYAAGRLLPRLPRIRSRYLVPFILIFGMLYRGAVLPAPPSITTDMYRYVWDGRLTLHGINPYRWSPNAQTLRSLRDPVWEKMEYKAYQTIYMPVSQLIFAGCNALFQNNLIGYKLIYTLFDLGIMAILLVLLRQMGQPPTQIIWYAWCPLPITEISLAGHQDVVGVFFLLLAFLLSGSKRARDFGAVALVASILTKGFALLLLPLFCRRYGMRFAVVAAVALVYLGMPIWVYLPQFLHGMNQYLENVHVNAGLFHFMNIGLSPLLRHPYNFAVKISDLIMLTVMIWAAWRPTTSQTDFVRRAFIVLAVTLLVVPTLFPWYLVWVLPFMALLGRRPSWAFVLLTGLVVLLYTYYISLQAYWWTPIAEYIPFYLVLAWEYRAWLRAHGIDPRERLRNWRQYKMTPQADTAIAGTARAQRLEI